MTIKKDEIVHIMVRRLFESDLRRHFLGIVKDFTPISIRVEGNVYIFDGSQNSYVKKLEKRTKLFSLSDNLILVNILPPYLVLEDLYYKVEDSKTFISDNMGFSLEINEFNAQR